MLSNNEFLMPYNGRVVWYVYGPMGCGKTHNARAICEFLGAESFRDDPPHNRRTNVSKHVKALFDSIHHGVKSVVRFSTVGLPVSPVTAMRSFKRRDITFYAHQICVLPGSEDAIYMLSYSQLKEMLGFEDSPMEVGPEAEPDVRSEGDDEDDVQTASVAEASVAKSKHSVRVERLWHTDTMGNKNPDALVDKLFVHAATSHLYRVTGCGFDATADEWCVHYKREMGETAPFSFTRTMSDFLTPGKFIKVK